MGIGPELPPHLQKSRRHQSDDDSDDQDNIGPSVGPSFGPDIGPRRPPPANEQQEPVTAEDFAPELPPELLEARRLAKQRASSGGPSSSLSSSEPKRVVGPTLPPSFVSSSSSSSYDQRRHYDDDSDDDDIVGPVLPSNLDREELSKQSRIREFEERSERMRKKLAGEDEKPTEKSKKPVREDWMMVPPESKILGDDPLKITARTFQKREQKPQDSSLWTETPADREKRSRGGPRDEDDEERERHKRSKRRGSDDDDDHHSVYRSRADKEREEQIRKYNAERRSESLMEAHSSSYIKSKAWQNNDGKEDNPSARPFDREKDVLGGRKIDHRQRDELVKQASDLGSKFARGKKSSFL
ncbi:hypothetical protein BGZ83_006224 [Gryganskiella cystojenkinii]|nr:hypothetical protein BGZ83_006224 [Gryganskiella cystojenkinii]